MVILNLQSLTYFFAGWCCRRGSRRLCWSGRRRDYLPLPVACLSGRRRCLFAVVVIARCFEAAQISSNQDFVRVIALADCLHRRQKDCSVLAILALHSSYSAVGFRKDYCHQQTAPQTASPATSPARADSSSAARRQTTTSTTTAIAAAMFIQIKTYLIFKYN